MDVRATVAIALAGVVLACGSGTSPDVAAYQKLAADVAVAVDTHTINATTGAGCIAERDRYGAAIRPMLDRMSDMSVDMDACMRGMGHVTSADMQSTCRSMRGELDDHLAAACAAQDVAAEAERHASAMKRMLQHEMDEAGGMQDMMGNRAMMASGMCHG